MSSLADRFAPVWRQLSAYEVSWRQDHAAAMRCRELEDFLAIGLNAHQLLQRIEEMWRERVFRGTEDCSDEDDARMREVYRLWLATTVSVLEEVPALERQFGVVEGAAEVRASVETVRVHLDDWQAPRVSSAVGLREVTLTPEAVVELERIIQAATDNPPAMPSRRLEVKDASFLKPTV